MSYNLISDISVAEWSEHMSKKGEETKQLIREKACFLFSKKGFKNVTMKDICLETGLSRGGLYRHYESTQQIFMEIINLLMSKQDTEIFEKIQQGYPATQILNEILERYKTEMLDTTASLSVAIFEFFSANYSSDKENVLLKQYFYAVKTWKNLINYGVQRGEFKNINCEEIIDIILFSYQGVRMYSSMMPLDEKIPQRIINHIQKILLV